MQLEARLVKQEQAITARRVSAFLDVGIRPPSRMPISTGIDPAQRYLIDSEAQRTLYDLVRRARLSLDSTIRLWRGQTSADPRPNKALCSDHLEWLLHDYVHRDRVIATIRDGVDHQFNSEAPSFSNLATFTNHRSAQTLDNALARSIREGQDAGTYMLLDVDAITHWKGLQLSSFGCVPKADADPSLEARVIHDLSFPRGRSTNDHSDQDSLPSLVYVHVGSIARRIETQNAADSARTIKIMRGDVKSAFRHLHGHPTVCARFAGYLPERRAVVIDLALPFGWTGSPAHYGAFGSAISFLVQRESPSSLRPSDGDTELFYCYDWVDDYVLVEEDRGDRLDLCETSLRLAMLAVLGPRSINNKKFTQWSTQARALGLDWDTNARTVSMPEEKIQKALVRVRSMLGAADTS